LAFCDGERKRTAEGSSTEAADPKRQKRDRLRFVRQSNQIDAGRDRRWRGDLQHLSGLQARSAAPQPLIPSISRSHRPIAGSEVKIL